MAAREGMTDQASSGLHGAALCSVSCSYFWLAAGGWRLAVSANFLVTLAVMLLYFKW